MDRRTKKLQDKLNEKFGEQFELLEDMKGQREKIKIKHKVCGHIWETTPDNIRQNGSCPLCGEKRLRKKKSISLKEAEKRFKKENKYKIISGYKNFTEKCNIQHIECGHIWETTPARALRSLIGCPNCKGGTPINKKEILKRFESVTDNDYELIGDYVNIDSKMKVKHLSCGHVWEVRMDNFLNAGNRCPKCCNKISNLEAEVINFIKDNYEGEILISDRKVLKPKELDIYLPDLKLAFEFDGLYWHSESKKGKNYHLNKTDECENQNIQLIHVFENEWVSKKKLVKSKILNLLKKNTNKIYARKCEVLKLSNEEKKIFFENNHLQGDANSSIHYGLKHNGEIVSAISFSKLRNSMSSKSETSSHELLRYASKTNTSIVGGFSKLLKNVLKKETQIKKIKTFADRRWSLGSVYEKNGFVFSHNSKPNYFYFKQNNQLFSRIEFQKHKLKDKLDVFDPKKSEKENMRNNNFDCIYDSGNKVYYYAPSIAEVR